MWSRSHFVLERRTVWTSTCNISPSLQKRSSRCSGNLISSGFRGCENIIAISLSLSLSFEYISVLHLKVIQVFIAQLLLAGEGDTIFALQSLVGAVGMTAFTYFLPLLFFNLLLGDRISWSRRCWHGVNFIAGVRLLWLFPLQVF